MATTAVSAQQGRRPVVLKDAKRDCTERHAIPLQIHGLNPPHIIQQHNTPAESPMN
jgi:hypothetical protein